MEIVTQTDPMDHIIPFEPSLQTWFAIGRDFYLAEQSNTLPPPEEHISLGGLITDSLDDDAQEDSLRDGVYDEDLANHLRYTIIEAFECGQDTPELDEILQKNGCVWTGYTGIGVVCSDNLLYKASIGATPLTPETFASGAPKYKPLKVRGEAMEGTNLGLRRLGDCVNGRSYNPGDGWTNKNLRKSIISLGLHKVGGDKEKLNTVLTFKLLTGKDEDASMTLPGLSVQFFPPTDPMWGKIRDRSLEEDFDLLDLVYWGRYRLPKQYLLNVYEKLAQL